MNDYVSKQVLTEKFWSNPIIPICCVVLIGLAVRIYFTPWHLPTNSFDLVILITEGLEYANGDFSGWSNRFLWPLFLSLFFLIFNFEESFDNVNLVRILSIIISVSIIPIVYFVAKNFVSKKYSILAAAFFAIEPNLIENSIFGITEQMFVLLGMISFYFIIQKNQRYQILSFVFAGLAFDTRLSGIVLFILLVSLFFLKKDYINKKTLSVGVLIFFIISFPAHFLLPLSENYSPFPIINEIGISVTESETTYSTYTEGSSSNLVLNAVKNEFMHIFRISIPFLLFLTPIGIAFSIMKWNFNHKMLFLVIGISLVIAIPQYTVSNEYRNLFFLIPFFCIFSAIGLEKISHDIPNKNIFLVIFFAGLILLSGNFLRERFAFDETEFLAKDAFGKYIAENIEGNITGDFRLEIIRNISNMRDDYYFTNGIISFYDPGKIMDSNESLAEYILENDIDFIVIDKNNQNSHFPIFERVLGEKDSFDYLEMYVTSGELNFEKIDVEIYKVNLDNLSIIKNYE